MKKIILSLFSLALMNTASADGPLQLRLGVMGLHANTWLLSTNYNNTNFETTPSFTWSTNLGAVASLYFTDRLGVEVNAIFGKYRQKYTTESKLNSVNAPSDYETEISKIDVPVLLKLGKLIYVEAGPQFTFVSKVTEKTDNGELDMTSLYQTNQVFGVAGMGVGFAVPKIVHIEAGLRAGYGFSDYNGERYVDRLTPFFWGFKLSAVHKF